MDFHSGTIKVKLRKTVKIILKKTSTSYENVSEETFPSIVGPETLYFVFSWSKKVLKSLNIKKRWPWGKTKIEGLYSTLTAVSVAVLFNHETFSKLYLIISCSVPQEVKVRSHRSTVNLK